MGFLGLFFSFQGRINRTQYWLGNILANVIGGLFTNTGSAALLIGQGETEGGISNAAMGMGLVWFVAGLVNVWISFALTVKRLHDRGRTGWLSLCWIVPVIWIGWSIGWQASRNPGDMAALGQSLVLPFILLLVAFLYLFIDLGLLAGQPEANAYGDPPADGFMPASTSRYRSVDLDARLPTNLGSAEEALDRAIAERRGGSQPVTSYAPSRLPPAATASSPMGRPIVSSAPQGFGRRGL